MTEEPSWKVAIRAQFESALAELDEVPETFAETADDVDAEPIPDIYTFYESLSALRHEVRQGNRRTVDAFSQFGDSLSGFDEELKQLRRQRKEEEKQASSGKNHSGIPQSMLLPLVEIADRLERLRLSFTEPPTASGGWLAKQAVSKWRAAWEERQTAAKFVADQLQALLRTAGLTPIAAKGEAFDPARMTAVGRDENPSESAQGSDLIVTEIITRGYSYQNNIVRLAEVRVGC